MCSYERGCVVAVVLWPPRSSDQDPSLLYLACFSVGSRLAARAKGETFSYVKKIPSVSVFPVLAHAFHDLETPD